MQEKGDVPLSEPIRLTAAAQKDLPQMSSFLKNNGLPDAGVEKCLDNFLIAINSNDSWVGLAGFELYSDRCLLRSVAVDIRSRSRGHGRALVGAVLRNAKAKGAKTAYLLTEGASGYFERLGFSVVDRKDIDEDVKTSVEFKELCPETAVAMRKAIG